MLTDLASVRPYIDSGKLLVLAVTDKTSLLPTAPTLRGSRVARHHGVHVVLGAAASQGALRRWCIGSPVTWRVR